MRKVRERIYELLIFLSMNNADMSPVVLKPGTPPMLRMNQGWRTTDGRARAKLPRPSRSLLACVVHSQEGNASAGYRSWDSWYCTPIRMAVMPSDNKPKPKRGRPPLPLPEAINRPMDEIAAGSPQQAAQA